MMQNDENSVLKFGVCDQTGMNDQSSAEIDDIDPFDAHGVARDTCADIEASRVAMEIAFALIPDAIEPQPYFVNATRLLIGVMASLHPELAGLLSGRTVTPPKRRVKSRKQLN